MGRDLAFAFLNLLAVQPFVLLMLVLTIYLGKLIIGADFGINKHQELESLISHSQLSIRIMIVFTSCLVMPVFEEMLFRGLFQSMVRSYLQRPWLSIVLSSAVFAAVHPDPAHWPALFVLAGCLGYSYEKSGSLFRPIFIHIIFNTISVIGTLLISNS